LDTLRAVHTVAGGDVLLAILSGMILIQQLLRMRGDCPREGHQYNPRGPGRVLRHSTLYTSATAKSRRYGKAGSGVGIPGASGVRAVLSNIATIV
jgi:hypothetical protein